MGVIVIQRAWTGKDGVVRFFVRNKNGTFYIRCAQDEILDLAVLTPGVPVLIAGRLISFFDKKTRRHQVVIRALAITATVRGQSLSVLRKFELTDASFYHGVDGLTRIYGL